MTIFMLFCVFYNIISIVLVLMNHNRYPFLSLFFKFFLIRQMTAALKPLPACHTYSLHLQISLICCVRKSDFLLYKKSCMLTDRMSGILRIRPSLLYCSESVYSMFSHVSSLHSSLSFLTFISIASSFLFRNIFI